MIRFSNCNTCADSSLVLVALPHDYYYCCCYGIRVIALQIKVYKTTFILLFVRVFSYLLKTILFQYFTNMNNAYSVPGWYQCENHGPCLQMDITEIMKRDSIVIIHAKCQGSNIKRV